MMTTQISQKVQLTYKLFLLENARNTLEQELLNSTNKAYEEVQGFLHSSVSNTVFSDLAKALETKRQAIEKLSALLQDPTVEPEACAKNGVRTNQVKSRGDKGITMTDVLKFGPMLQNSLTGSSIAKAVQVLGAALSPKKLKHFLISQPATLQQDDMCTISPSYNSSATANTSTPAHLKAKEKEHDVVFEEKRPPDAASPPPVIIPSTKISAERPPPLLLPPIEAVLSEIGNPKPMRITPIISWGYERDVQVLHQKQTSSQLLHFLRAKAKNTGALEVMVMEWSKSTASSRSPRSKSPTITTQRYQVRQDLADDPMDELAPKTLHADIENQAPVFRIKRVESSGSLTYTCVIATKTELWDIGDIFTQVGQESCSAATMENKQRAQLQQSSEKWDTQTLLCTEPKQKSNSSAPKTPLINGISIPEFQIRKFEETEVVVSHIVSPGKFYIQHADSITKLQALVTGSWKASSSYAEQNCIPDIGTQVMGWFPEHEQWCRAQVTKICGVSGDDNALGVAGTETSIKVEVKRLDHGDSACLSLSNMRELSPELAVLPLQAVQVSLANVTPVNGSGWSEEAVGWFRAMVHNRMLHARIYPQGPNVTVELFLEKGKLGAMRRGASVSLRLAQNGHAKHDRLKNVGLLKKSSVKLRQQDADWEKYLISCYTQSKK